MPRTNFRPGVDGFAFQNSWSLDATEVDQIRRLFQDTVSLSRMALMFLPYNPLAWLIFRDLKGRLATWVDQAVVGAYGLCGGMVFAALDYYNAGRDVPRGRGPNDPPTRDTFEGAALRDYLWRRLIDSLTLNAPTFLTWMAFLHIIPDQPIFRGGPHWLCKQSIRHWKTLKRHIDAGRPWPIGLVAATTDPTFNH